VAFAAQPAIVVPTTSYGGQKISTTNGATVNPPVHSVASATMATRSKSVASMGIYIINKLVCVVNATKLDDQTHC
jgi:hypothetical protein